MPKFLKMIEFILVFMLPEIKAISCPNCASKNIKKAGVKRNQLRSLQKYFCKDCYKTFSLDSQTKNKTYPARIVLNAMSLYNLGHTQLEIIKLISKRFKVKPSQKTVSNWIREYKHICTFHKLRSQARKLFQPQGMVEKREFVHGNLPYVFQVHYAKLEILFTDARYNNRFTSHARFYAPIKAYLEKVVSENFPHHIFEPAPCSNNGKSGGKDYEQRASQLKFPYLEITRHSKTNLANRLAGFALNLAKTNRERHEKIQEFMLVNDSVTVAVEVPVYLTRKDIAYFLGRNFRLPFADQKTPITGHIDVLQVRNGLIHVLDYKPMACKVDAVNQLIIYALALASRTKLDLKSFKCAWFNEEDYFEFFPLHCVYKKKNMKRLPKGQKKLVDRTIKKVKTGTFTD